VSKTEHRRIARYDRLAEAHRFLDHMAQRLSTRRGGRSCVACALRLVLALASEREHAAALVLARGRSRGRGRPRQAVLAWAAACVAAYTVRCSRSRAPDWRQTAAILREWGIDHVQGTACSARTRHVTDRLRHLVNRSEFLALAAADKIRRANFVRG
jgi:hypothetical protein